MTETPVMSIERVAVIGSGVMGAGIAAHVANAGVPVLLLDIVPKDAVSAEDRSRLARDAIARMVKADPAPFTHKRRAELVTPGNLEDDLAALAACDWIIEAVVEDEGVKTALYDRIDAVRKPGAAVSSNTSTIPLERLVAGRSGAFSRDFLITHFFNPPRYMRLLELVTGPATDPMLAAAVAEFCDVRLGKGVVRCHDRPGFIANRVGVMWLQTAINAAVDLGLTVEEADAVGGRPMGVPKTGIFGLLDLVGLDLMPHIAQSLSANLPEGDAYRKALREHPLIARMIADGYTGRKGKGGFYRLNRDGGAKTKQAIDLVTGDYRDAEKPRLESLEAAGRDLAALVRHPDKTGRFAARVLAHTLAYAASLVPEIADDPGAVDEAMRLGYGWKWGPFELIDRLGHDVFAEICADAGVAVPPLVTLADGRPFQQVEDGRLQGLGVDGAYADVVRPEGVLLLRDVKLKAPPVWRNGSAALWDIGDGVLCLEFTSKMNAIDADTMKAHRKAIELIGDGSGDWKALVIHNEGANFSVGANLGLAMFALNIAMWPAIEELVADGQATYRALRDAPFPVVAAPSGMALGGGCEVLLVADHVQAHVETYVGLVEVGVGLLPGWGGSTELVARAAADPDTPKGPMPPVARAFETISLAKVAKSAEEARDLLFLRPTDGITMNRDRLLADAKAKALELAKDYAPRAAPVFQLPGPSGRATLNMLVAGFRLQGKATPHDVTVSDKVAEVLTGGDTDPLRVMDEAAMLALERRAFMELVRTGATLDRIEHMLTTGKPLRN